MNNGKALFYILLATVVAVLIALTAIGIYNSFQIDEVIMAPGAPGVDYSNRV